MDASDAPIYAWNDSTLFEGDAEFEGLINLFLHHALHVVVLHDRAEMVGLEHVMYANDSDPRFVCGPPLWRGACIVPEASYPVM